MAIAEANLVTALGDTTNQSTPYSLGSVTPTASRLLVVCGTAATSVGALSIGGTLGATWEEIFNINVIAGRRMAAWAALCGAGGLGTGTITIGNAAASAMTGMAYKASQFSGAYMGGSALDAFYGYATASSGAATSLQVPPGEAYAAAGDATLAFLALNLNVALTCERTEIADAGFSTPTHRIGMQWFLGNDSDGPLFSWTGSGVADVVSIYMRDAANPPPASAWVPQAVTLV